tara:strand:+ start:98 stop:559 length:462 start_codon:yes stop_codon:yes gene_type:complete
MDFKFKSTIFSNSKEDQQRLYKDKYDPNKPYPNCSGTLLIPTGQIAAFVEYFHWALRTKELKYDGYIKDEVIPIQISGWTKTSEKSGKKLKFLSLEYEPDYRTKLAAKEAKSTHEIAEHQKTIDHQQGLDTAAASLAKGTAGTVVEETEEDII